MSPIIVDSEYTSDIVQDTVKQILKRKKRELKGKVLTDCGNEIILYDCDITFTSYLHLFISRRRRDSGRACSAHL